MEYKLSEQELKDLMHRSWLKAKDFYKGQTDEYFYDFFEREKKQLTITVVSNRRELLLCGICDEETMHNTTNDKELICLVCGNVAK